MKKLKQTATLGAMIMLSVAAPLMTKWAKEVNPDKPLPEYPRPQMVRKDWLNLNGVWEYQSGKMAIWFCSINSPCKNLSAFRRAEKSSLH